MMAASEGSEAWTAAQLFDKGGWLMWVLLMLSLVMVVVVFVCFWTTRQGAVLPRRMVEAVDSCIVRKDYPSILALCEKESSSFSQTVCAVIRFMQRNPNAGMDEVREVASAEASRQVSILTRQISWLSDIGSIAPMIGLLGTVWGMMKTFKELADGNFEGAKHMGMASGIYEAMITTAGGLVLAIPSMMAYVFFRSRIQKHTANMEVALTHVLSMISEIRYRDKHPALQRSRAQGAEVLVDDED